MNWSFAIRRGRGPGDYNTTPDRHLGAAEIDVLEPTRTPAPRLLDIRVTFRADKSLSPVKKMDKKYKRCD